jgi:peptidoglycan/LPS O-acetylase OafA/YrhL
MMFKTKYRRDIQALRGLAVLAVIAFHVEQSYFPLGYLGVDVFFVISGFVITPLILRIFSDQGRGGHLSNLGYFYKRRFYRLAPALAVTLTVSMVLILLLMPTASHEAFAIQGIATLLLSGNFSAYRDTTDYFMHKPNPITHTWSLSVEEQIYIFLPIVLMIFLHNRRSPKKMTAVVLGCISVISFISFLLPAILQPMYSLAGITQTSEFSFYSPIARIWQFTIGGVGSLLLNRYQSYKLKISKNVNLLAVISVVIVLFGPIYMSLEVNSILATFIAVIVIAFKSLNVLPETLITKLEWLGDRSYSIYLVHMPLISIAKYSPFTQFRNDENRIVQSIIALVATILLGALSYSKIENRYRNIGKSNYSGLKTISISLVLTFIIPLTLFCSMYIGQNKLYWGLDRNIPLPTGAWELDPNCNRMSVNHQPCFYRILKSKQTVLLIGDSHAAHLSQAVVDAAKLEDWNSAVWTLSACQVHFQRNISNQVTNQCLEQNLKILKWVERHKPKAIIVSQFVKFDSSQSDLRNALLALRLIVPNILLIENNPIFPDEKDFMVSRPLLISVYEPPKSFKSSKMQVKDRSASDQLASWARENRISTMNIYSLFCTKEICFRYADSDWLYRDIDHLSEAGAALTIPQLRNYLRKF